MARDRANINTNIWTDTHWRTLTADQQWLYKLLLTHPELNYAGVADWRPGRLSQFASDKSKLDIERIGAALQSEKFIMIDETTEEVLIRSFLKHDGLLKQPKLSISMVNAYGSVASKEIREVIIHELKRIHSYSPDLKAFENDKVQALLRLPARPMEAFTLGFTPELTLGFTLNDAQAQALPTTTATTTATPTDVGGSGRGRRKPELPLPESWAPKSAHFEFAKEKNLNIANEAERFTFHAKANDRRLRDWDSGFRMWLSKANPMDPVKKSPWSKEFHNG